MVEQARDEFYKWTKELKQVLDDNEKEIRDAKDQLHLAKEVAVREYRDSNALIAELTGSYTDEFDDAVRQAKKAYPGLDFSRLNIDDQNQTTA